MTSGRDVVVMGSGCRGDAGMTDVVAYASFWTGKELPRDSAEGKPNSAKKKSAADWSTNPEVKSKLVKLSQLELKAFWGAVDPDAAGADSCTDAKI